MEESAKCIVSSSSSSSSSKEIRIDFDTIVIIRNTTTDIVLKVGDLVREAATTRWQCTLLLTSTLTSQGSTPHPYTIRHQEYRHVICGSASPKHAAALPIVPAPHAPCTLQPGHQQKLHPHHSHPHVAILLSQTTRSDGHLHSVATRPAHPINSTCHLQPRAISDAALQQTHSSVKPVGLTRQGNFPTADADADAACGGEARGRRTTDDDVDLITCMVVGFPAAVSR